MKPFFRSIWIASSLFGLICVAIIGQVQFQYEHRIVAPIEATLNIEHADAILVLGGGLKPDGTPSDALRDRLLVGMYLLQQGLADRIVVTGDDGKFHQNETDAMKAFLLDHGVPVGAIQVDGQGYRTYESCKNAAMSGWRRVIVVTQRFHMGRAVYLCSHLGLVTDGVTADLHSYQRITYFWARDLLASVKAWFDITVFAPKSPVE